jgi:hypothetical protein
MSFVIQNDLARAMARSAARAPIATVFGAGIAGLSVAHELIERGFTVQVVEALEDFDEEYACLVGGMAANQYGRIPAEVEDLHPYLFKPLRPGSDRADTGGDGARGVRFWIDPTRGAGLVQIVSISGGPGVPVASFGKPPNVLLADLATAINGMSGYSAVPHATEPLTLVVTSSDPMERPDVRIDAWVFPYYFSRSDYVRAESTAGIAPLRACRMQRVQPRVALAQRIQFDRSVVPATPAPWLLLEDEHGVENGQKLDAILHQLQIAYDVNRAAFRRLRDEQVGGVAKDFWLSRRMERREVLLVEVRGHTDRDDEEEGNRALSLAWAELVKAELLRRNTLHSNPIPALDQRLVTVGVGSAEPIGNRQRAAGRRRDNRVELRIVENRIPGEHGYRYFPGFYRHLFDTMRRTPILDADGSETGDTAYDQLVATETIDLALANERAPETVPVQRPRSLQELRRLVRLHLDPKRLHVRERDLLRFQVKLLKFLSACPARRAQWEDLTWWDFLDGDGYSERMREILMNTPEALIAMNAGETDAHSQGLIYLHILIESMGGGEPANRTLNGPTTDAWLRHWKRYLKRQGVRFFLGRLNRLVVGAGGGIHPEVTTRSAYAAQAQVVVVPTASQVYPLHVNGFHIEVPSAAAGRGGVAADVAAGINAALDAGAAAVVTADGFVRLTPTVPLGSHFARVARPGVALGASLRLNGVTLGIEPGDVVASARNTILNSLNRHIVAEGWHLRVVALGDRSLHIDPVGVAIVSITNAAIGDVGIEIDGVEVSVRNERVYAPSRWDRGLLNLRNELLEKLVARGVAAVAFGDTGIEISGAPLPRLAPGRFVGRVKVGPDLLPDVGAPFAFESVAPGAISMITFPPATLVLGPIPEEPEHEYVEADPANPLPAPGAGPDFYFLAVPYLEASRLVSEINAPVDGCFQQLLDFNVQTGVGQPVAMTRDGNGRPLDAPGKKYPLRELTGIQYYFNNQIRIGRGHTYYLGSPWGLSSISQLSYWRDRPSERSAFLGQLSVDIGSFYAPLGFDGQSRPSAWNSGRQEIAEEVWNQLTTWIDRDLMPGRRYKQFVPTPGYYHLDRNLDFDVDPPRRYGRAVEIALDDIAAPHPYTLTFPPLPAVAVNTLDPQFVATAIEVAGGVAVGVSPSRLVVAPLLQRTSRVRVLVRSPDANSRFALRIGGALVRHPALAADPADAIRDALVAAINAAVPGALAQPEVSADPTAPVRFTIQLAPNSTVRALACALDPVSSEVKHFLELEDGGELVASLGAGLSIANEPAVQYNTTPFMINPPGIWVHRPGLDRTAARRTGEYEHPNPYSIWYPPTKKRWFMVGNHMATHTRISTMESANESARHAVLRALHELAMAAPGANSDYNSAGVLFGQMPDLWDPAEHEPEDVVPLKKIDEKLCQQRHPHPLEILRVEEWVDSLPEDLIRDDFPEHLDSLLRGLRDQLKKDWEATDRDELVEGVAIVIDKMLKGI